MDGRAAWAIGGEGPRRWGLCDRLGLQPGETAWLPRVGASGQRHFRLDHRDLRGSAQRVLDALQSDRAAGHLAVGWIGYEIGAALEGVACGGRRSWPDAAWWICGPEALRVARLPALPATNAPLAPQSLRRQGARYRRDVAGLVERIAAGEFYQVNLTVTAAAGRVGERDASAVVAALMAAQPVPLAWALCVPGYPNRVVASGSMERFLRLDGDRIATRPIKGTTARGDDPERDAQLAAALLAKPKERAENTMIVDMARNDIQRVCAPLSVVVTSLLQAVPYSTLWHLESEVEGNLRTRDIAEVLRATLPPASVTGCPKVQAMKAIAATERRQRGPYCGATFCLDPAGVDDFAVAIRTLRLDRGAARIDVGAGIVAESDPASEWVETCRKAVGALRALSLLERLHA